MTQHEAQPSMQTKTQNVNTTPQAAFRSQRTVPEVVFNGRLEVEGLNQRRIVQHLGVATVEEVVMMVVGVGEDTRSRWRD